MDHTPHPGPGAALHPRVAETHTGVVILLGDRAYKAKKPVVTDFLDFSTVARREQACVHEVDLNRRLAPDSYLGVAHFGLPGAEPEPVIVMRRHPDDRRLAELIRGGADVTADLAAVAGVLARFHAGAARGPRHRRAGEGRGRCRALAREPRRTRPLRRRCRAHSGG